MKFTKIFIIFFIILAAIILFFYCAEKFFSPPNKNMIWGASFSPEYTQFLGLDVQETYRVILDDYKFKYLRLSARWDKVENEKGKFDFSQIDYLVAEAGKRQAKVVLAIGQKTPRWPECNVPDWTKNLSDSEYFSALNNYLQKTAEHFKDNSAVEIWQVENEPFLAFGAVCRGLDSEKLNTEITTVRNTDSSRPVLVTDSGELSLWNKTAKAGDLFGSTVYRVVGNEYLGYVGYDWLPSVYYRWRALWHGRELKDAFVAELQAEPWLPGKSVNEANIVEQFKSMNFDRLQKNVEFARKTGFSRSYLWGAEWWYWLALHGDSQMSDYIKNLQK